jgi:plastocyanin
MAPRTHIRRHAPVPLAILALALAGCGGGDDGGKSGGGGGGGSAAAPAAAKVDIKDFKFVPDPIRVRAGGSVTWTNSDSAPHTAETDGSKPSAFDTGTLKQGDSKKVAFAKAGKFTYFCSFHRFMTGTVEVVG